MRKVLFLSKGNGASSTRYRALQYFNLLKNDGYEAEHKTVSGGVFAFARALKQAMIADIVVVIRKTFPYPMLWLLRRFSRRLVFDFDDAIFCNTDGTPSPTRMQRFAAIVGVCDHVLAGNGFLQQSALMFNKSVTLLPTSLEVDRYRVDVDKPDDSIDLVWIGSSSTRKYLVEAFPALRIAAENIPGLRLKIVADFDYPDVSLKTLPVSWAANTEAIELASSHIGIAPMRDDDWSRGKCALKVLQYMAAGLPVVSSGCGANAEVIDDGVSGFLVLDDQAWVKRIIELAGDATLRNRMGGVGREKALAEYDTLAVFQRMCSVFNSLLLD